MIIAVGGSRCSSEASTRNSRERCADWASDWLSPAASAVDAPHAVLAAIPAVNDSDSLVPRDVPSCAERDVPPASGSRLLPAGRERPLPREVVSLSEAEAATDDEPLTVLV